MEDVLKALESLRIPKEAIGVIALLIYAWPHLRSTWLSWRQRTETWAQYRRELELLKLRCEIELLKRTNNLPDPEFCFPPLPHIVQPLQGAVVRTRLPLVRRFLFGLLGGFAMVTGLI